jgi:hypothetical protein
VPTCIDAGDSQPQQAQLLGPLAILREPHATLRVSRPDKATNRRAEGLPARRPRSRSVELARRPPPRRGEAIPKLEAGPAGTTD